MEVGLISAWAPPAGGEGGNPQARIPLGLAYLASSLERHGVRYRCLDLQRTAGLQDDLLRLLGEAGPVVGVSCMSDQLPVVVAAIRHWKRSDPSTVVILGGPGPSGVASRLVREFPQIDHVVRGEGEESLPRLLHAIERGHPPQGIPGVVTARAAGCGPAPVRLQDLDVYHPLPLRQFADPAYSPVLPISTARGCPYGCTFCDVSGAWRRRTVWRQPGRVVEEVLGYHERGTNAVTFVDDTFVLDRRHVHALCRGLRRIDGFSWHCNGRIDRMDEALLAEMREAGCASIFYGVESGSDAVLRRIGKRITVEQVERVVRLSARYCLTTVSFIWGFPFETMEDFRATHRLASRLREIEGVRIQAYLLTPLPNSKLFQEYGHRLEFDRGIRGGLATSGPLSGEMAELVRLRPDLFASSHLYPTPNRVEKLVLLEQAPLD